MSMRDRHDAPRPAPGRRCRAGRRGAAAGAAPAAQSVLTIVMTLMLVYALLPLFWLVVNSTKTQAALFSTFGLWFGGKFALFEQHPPGLHLRQRHLRPLARQHAAVRRGRRGRRHPARHARRLRPGQVRLPRQARRVRGGARRGRGPGHRPGRADLPAVQRAGPDQHAVGGHPAVAGQPVRPVPDLDLRVRGGADRDCSRRRGSTARGEFRTFFVISCGCSPPAWSRCCCSPWSRPGTTTSCR